MKYEWQLPQLALAALPLCVLSDDDRTSVNTGAAARAPRYQTSM